MFKGLESGDDGGLEAGHLIHSGEEDPSERVRATFRQISDEECYILVGDGSARPSSLCPPGRGHVWLGLEP